MGRSFEPLAWLLPFFCVINGLQAIQQPSEQPALSGIRFGPPTLGTPPPAARIQIGAVAPGAKNRAELLGVSKIWGQAPSSGFTDLIRFRERWYCAFREGSGAVSKDGSLRVISSPDTVTWASSAVVSYPGVDLRDPKFSVTPDRRLMLSAGMITDAGVDNLQSLAWYSLDGRAWGEPLKIGEPGIWLWRVTWHQGNAYSMGYSTRPERFLRFYVGPEGLRFQTIAEKAYAESAPTEATLLFRNDDTALCLLRRDGGTGTACLGQSRPPYRSWSWRDLGVRLTGPNLAQLPDGRVVAAGMLHDVEPRTSLYWLDPKDGTAREFMTLPSAGESSYPGLAWHENILWVSYHSSHEGKSAIYLARVRVPESE